MATNRILIVEDDVDILRLLSRELEDAGFEVAAYDSGMRGLSAVRESSPDLVILDLGLPDLSGQEIARRLRHTGNIPIIILTAADEVGTKVEMLNAGADDYLAKPFDLDELEARVRALARRSPTPSGSDRANVPAAAEFGGLRCDPASGAVYFRGAPLDLAPRESALLRALLARPGLALAKERLFELVFPGEAQVQAEAIEVVAYRLRKKLGATGTRLVTLRGLGYLLKAQP